MTANAQDLAAFLVHQLEIWNRGDRDAFFAAHRAFAGNFHVEFPIGTPVRSGWEQLEAVWEKQSGLFTITYEHLCITDTDEVAVAVRNDATVGGRPFTMYSIELYRIADDGLHARWYTEGPPAETFRLRGD
jgi:hypothetical protein